MTERRFDGRVAVITGAGRAIIAAAIEHYGGIDILIHSAGNVRCGSLAEMTEEDFKAVLDVHLMGALHAVRAARSMPLPIPASCGCSRPFLPALRSITVAASRGPGKGRSHRQKWRNQLPFHLSSNVQIGDSCPKSSSLP
jgi:NAD(P)-dependent dehydrogenase (short-subunit alcohol dehydrogenase family)